MTAKAQQCVCTYGSTSCWPRSPPLGAGTLAAPNALLTKGVEVAPNPEEFVNEKAGFDAAPKGAGCVLPNAGAAWVAPKTLVDVGVAPKLLNEPPPNALEAAGVEAAPKPPPPKALVPKAGELVAPNTGALLAAPNAGADPVEPNPPPPKAAIVTARVKDKCATGTSNRNGSTRELHTWSRGGGAAKW